MHQFTRIVQHITAIAGCVGLAACVDGAATTGTASQEILTTYSGNDPGAGPASPRPSSTAARASFVAALGGAATTAIDFEASPLGQFASMSPAPGVTITLSGHRGISGIVSGNASPLVEGYNTTAGGARYLKIYPDFGDGTVSATFDYASPIRGFGASFTGVGTVDFTSVDMLFDDGSAEAFAVPGAANGGASFFGFTDPGKGITQVTIRETLTSNGARDIFSIDDVLTAVDNQAPIAVCADLDLDANTACVGLGSVDGGSYDPDGGAFSCVAAPAAPYGLGATAVTLTCTDEYGASSSCTATVNVTDRTAPDLHCPADQTVECDDGHGGGSATFTAEAHDSCDSAVDVACAPPSGSTFPLGDTDASCTATDDAGNAASCSHTVSVVDTTPPVVTGSGSAGQVWPPNHRYRRVELSDCIGAIDDACHGPLTVAGSAQITCCASDESDDATGDGHTSDDCVIVDHDTVEVRAERDGGGNGRVYTLDYTVTDPSGNVTNGTCTVGVPHSLNGVPAVDDGPRVCGGHDST